MKRNKAQNNEIKDLLDQSLSFGIFLFLLEKSRLGVVFDLGQISRAPHDV